MADDRRSPSQFLRVNLSQAVRANVFKRVNAIDR